MSATPAARSRASDGGDDLPARPGTDVKASRRALSDRLGKMKEFSHLTGRHLQGTVTKADIAAVQRAADLPKSRRRLSAMANSLADNAMSTSGLVLAPNRQMNAQRKPREVRDTSKGKSAVYSRETLRARASAKPSASPGSLTPGPAMPTSADFRSGGAQPLFLDAGRRKSKGTTPKTSQVSGEKPSASAKGTAYLADTKAEPASGSAVQAGRRDSAVSAFSPGEADSSRGLAAGQSPPVARGQGHQPPAGSSGAVLVKEPASGCCTVM